MEAEAVAVASFREGTCPSADCCCNAKYHRANSDLCVREYYSAV